MNKLLLSLMLIASVTTAYANNNDDDDGLNDNFVNKPVKKCDTYKSAYKTYYSHCGKQDLIRSNKAKPQIANRYRMVVLTHENKIYNSGDVDKTPKKAYSFAWVDTKNDKIYSLPHLAFVKGDAKPRFIFKGKKACFSQKIDANIMPASFNHEETIQTKDELVCMGLTKDGLRIIGRDDMYSYSEQSDTDFGYYSFTDKDLI